MPWSHVSTDRMRKIYQTIAEDFLDVKDPDMVACEMFIRAEVLKRDFTKRQMNIINLICDLSYVYGKKSALITNMQDFEQCGVSKTKIRDELDKLIECSIVDWNKETNEFTLKDPTLWEVPYHSGFSGNRVRKMLIDTLEHSGYSTEDIIKRLEL